MTRILGRRHHRRRGNRGRSEVRPFARSALSCTSLRYEASGTRAFATGRRRRGVESAFGSNRPRNPEAPFLSTYRLSSFFSSSSFSLSLSLSLFSSPISRRYIRENSHRVSFRNGCGKWSAKERDRKEPKGTGGAVGGPPDGSLGTFAMRDRVTSKVRAHVLQNLFTRRRRKTGGRKRRATSGTLERLAVTKARRRPVADRR